MKLMLLPKDLSWWLWTILAVLLFAGLAGYAAGFIAAVLLSAIQTWHYYRKLRLCSHYAVQTPLAYALLMLVS